MIISKGKFRDSRLRRKPNATVENAHTRDQGEISPRSLHLLGSCSLLGDSLSDSDSYSRVTCAMGLVDATATARRTLGPEKRRTPCARRRCFLGGRGLRWNPDGGRGPEERTGPALRNVTSLSLRHLWQLGPVRQQAAMTRTGTRIPRADDSRMTYTFYNHVGR